MNRQLSLIRGKANTNTLLLNYLKNLLTAANLLSKTSSPSTTTSKSMSKITNATTSAEGAKRR